MRHITGYRMTVHRGAKAGQVREYQPGQRVRATRAADRIDSEYGAIAASVQPIWAEEIGEAMPSFTCTPASIAADHAAEMSFIDAQGFARASRQVAP